jgi:uncharacterized phage protein (TIGR02218 family)
MKTWTNIGGNDLLVFLANNRTMITVDLYTITLKNSVLPPLRYSNWDKELTVLGTTFIPGPPHFQFDKIDEGVGTEVATMNFDILASNSDLLSGTPILQTIVRGDWDGATVNIDRLFMNTANVQIGVVPSRWLGRLGDIQPVQRTKATFIAKSMLELLTMQIPRNLIQTSCIHTLFDAGCGLSKAAFQTAGTVIAGSTVNKVLATLAQATGYFELGTMVFTSGVLNSSLPVTIKSYTLGSPSIILLNRPLLAVPSAGDTFFIYPGCDKTQAACKNKFSNFANFLGFPFVPAPETAL